MHLKWDLKWNSGPKTYLDTFGQLKINYCIIQNEKIFGHFKIDAFFKMNQINWINTFMNSAIEIYFEHEYILVQNDFLKHCPQK